MKMQGFIDRIENGRLKGWAWDEQRPGSSVEVEILQEKKLLGRAQCDVFREDLKIAGIGDGKHGFEFIIPREVLVEDEEKITARFKGTKQFLSPVHPLMDVRKRLSFMYLNGSGIEIGALHNPLLIRQDVSVCYVDRQPLQDLKEHYRELGSLPVSRVDVVDDGERLAKFANASLDFIIENHFLEHCENPIGTIRNQIAKLKSNGVIYCTIPDKRFFWEKDRPATSFDHLIKDDKDGPEWSRSAHYSEWVKYHERNVHGPVSEEDEIRRAKELEKLRYSIHFHCWDTAEFLLFLRNLRGYLEHSFEIQAVHFNWSEVIAILRKS